MHFKLILAMVQDDQTDKIIEVTRVAGATGATIINNVRGEGMDVKKSFFGLSLEAQRDLIFFIVEEHLSRHILEAIESVIQTEAGNIGIAFKIDIEDIVGVGQQINKLKKIVEEEI